MRYALILLLASAGCAVTTDSTAGPPPVATFSIVAFDPETGDLGVAVQSKFFGVGSVVPWARAGVGAVATQAFANTTYGPDALDLLERGVAPGRVVETLTARDAGRDSRQLGLVNAKGEAAAYTGAKATAWAGHVVGEGFACQGNILAGEQVVTAMAKAYRETEAALPERLVAALAAGQDAGGDKRGRQSAAILVVRRGGGYAGFNDRYVDLRVEDHPKPIEELARLLAMHRRFFPNVPLPGTLSGFVMEPAPSGAPLASPRAAWETWIRLFGARDFEGMYAVQTEAYRDRIPYEKFVEETKANAGAIETFLTQVRYAGTRIEGEKATLALETPGARRPVLVGLALEDGEWRFSD